MGIPYEMEGGYLKIGIGHIVDYSQAGSRQILLGGALLPRLGGGGGGGGFSLEEVFEDSRCLR